MFCANSRMFPAPLLRSLQRHVAFAAVGPTTLRNMDIGKGGRKIVCEMLSEIRIEGLAADNFESELNRWTDDLAAQINGRWGPARKALNLFLRDLAYNVWIEREHKLSRLHGLFEVPLDGIVMGKLRAFGPELQKVWVKDLNRSLSDQYQAIAQSMAKKRGVARMHLDLALWNGGISAA